MGLWLLLAADNAMGQLFKEYWSSALTMLFGSFVAGATPLGGGAVSFPIFTKVLNVDTEQAKVFGLFIQSVGMTFATLLFVSLNIKIHWRWIAWLLPSSLVGLIIGLFYLPVAGEHIRLLLSVFVIISGILLVKTQLMYCSRGPVQVSRRALILLGLPAGVLSSLVGTGADALLFFCVVLIFRQNVKATIPTTVSYMAVCSLVGAVILLMSQATPISSFTINSWIVAAPVVAIGAPLGGFAMSKMSPKCLLLFIKTIILLEGVSTLMLVDLASLEKFLLLGLIIAAIVYLATRWKLVVNPNLP